MPATGTIADAWRIPRRHLWLALAASMCLLAFGLPRAGLVIDPWEHVHLLLMLTTAAILSTKAERAGKLWPLRWARLLESLALFLALTLVGVLASYVLSAWSSDYADPLLAKVDAVLGFDWMAAYRFTRSAPAVQWIGSWAYQCIGAIPLLLLAVLELSGKDQEARRFLLAYWMGLVFTMMCFPFFPAIGPLARLAADQMTYVPVSGVQHTLVIEAARRGALGDLEIKELVGMVTFPSFHAAAATLFMWFGRRLRGWRWPICAVSFAMLLSTPIEGNHYLVDLLAGIAVASLAIWLSAPARLRLATRQGRWRWRSAAAPISVQA